MGSSLFSLFPSSPLSPSLSLPPSLTHTLSDLSLSLSLSASFSLTHTHTEPGLLLLGWPLACAAIPGHCPCTCTSASVYAVAPLLRVCCTSVAPLLHLCCASVALLLHLYCTSVAPLLRLCCASGSVYACTPKHTQTHADSAKKKLKLPILISY